MAGTKKPKGRVDPAALESILEVTRRLAAPFDLRSVLEQVVEAGRRILEADRGTVFLYDRATHELVSAVATGVGTLRFPADRGIVGEVVRTRAILNVPDCYADPRFNPEGDRLTGYRTRCLLSIPLVGHDDSLVGVLQLLNKRDGSFDEADERTAAALAAQCAVALQRVQLTEQMVVKEKMERELEVARSIQVGLLPRAMPSLEGYDLAGMCRPADSTGGDTFDLVPVGDRRLVVLLGDATGHGIGPALSVTQAHSMLRMAIRLGASLDDAFRHINDQLVQDLPEGRGVTAFLGILDARAHEVLYHSGGQGPLLHFHAAEGRCEWLKATTFPLGFFEHPKPPKSGTIRLEPGDILGLLTDGVYECEDAAGEQFGEEGVASVLREHRSRPIGELVAEIAAAADRFRTGPQADDITILLLRRAP